MNKIFILLCLTTSACVHSVKYWKPRDFYMKMGDNDRRQCSPNKIPFIITKDVPDRLADNIRESFDYWNSLTEKDLFIYMGIIDAEYGPSFKKAGIVVVDLYNNKALYDYEPKDKEDNILAITQVTSYQDGCIYSSAIFIYDLGMNATESSFRSIIRHEIGHVLGLGHNPDTDGLMYEALGRYRIKVKGVSKYTLKAFNLYYK